MYFFQEGFLLLWHFPFVLLRNTRACRLLAASPEMSCTLLHWGKNCWSVLFSSNVNGKEESLESNAVLKMGQFSLVGPAAKVTTNYSWIVSFKNKFCFFISTELLLGTALAMFIVVHGSSSSFLPTQASMQKYLPFMRDGKPCCSLPAQTFFGHWPWEQTDAPLLSHSWLLERPYKYLAVGWMYSYRESGERKRRRRNNSSLKRSACGRVKRRE